MRAGGRDIVELFGYRPNDLSAPALQAFANRACPFTNSGCSKTNHDQSIVYGVCSVTNGVRTGPHDDVIVCPKRLYARDCDLFQPLIEEVWGQGVTLVKGGSLAELRQKAERHARPAIAFGQSSGTEIAVNSNGQMSMDWVIQLYRNDNRLIPVEFIGIEVQSIDITGNYRDNWAAYERMKATGLIPNSSVADSGHGLNWANVHKRLIPQIIRKGNIYREIDRCAGFYFVVPEMVYRKFEQVIGDLPQLDGPSKDRLSIKTYSLAPATRDGVPREVIPVRTVHYNQMAVAQAFITNVDDTASERLDARMLSIL